MRSSATAGLSPQQLLDRRRAQNKLAQRRFREKARMARSVGSTGNISFLPGPSELGGFAPHLDLAAPIHRHGLPRVRSDSSDSSCSSSSVVSLSSQVSSPTSTCTELNTPTMPTFNSLAQPDIAFLNNVHAPPMYMMQDPKADLPLAEGAFCMSGPSTFLPSHSYTSLDASYPAPASLASAPAPLTYSSLAASSSINRSLGLKMAGMHSDPFLMSQPLPSPSLLTGQSHNAAMMPNNLLLAHHSTHSSEPNFQSDRSFSHAPFAPQSLPQEATPAPSHSFENLLRIPSFVHSTASDASSSDNSSFSPSAALSSSSALSSASLKAEDTHLSLLTETIESSNESRASLSASLHLAKAISNHAAQSSSSSSAASSSSSIALESQSFSRVVELIGARFGLTQNGEGIDQLLSRLQLSGGLTVANETNKGLVFDAAIDWDAMGSNMLPTTEQLLYPHRAFLDACLPWPSVRSRLLKHTLTNAVCEEEFAMDLLLSVLSSDESVSSFRVYGDDVLEPEAWELSEAMLTKWWGLFDDSIIRRTNWWRRQRGLAALSVPTPSETANQYEQQGLGTGSLDQVHHLATSLFQ